MARSIYVAAPFDGREAAAAAQIELEGYGLVTTSSWIEKHLKGLDEELPAWQLAQEARQDLQDIDRAHYFVLLNDQALPQSTSGGRHFEMGYALAQKKEVFLLGPRTSVFHYLPAVNVLKSLEEIKGWL